jgi:ABC-type molybdate transport system substrate-binding protein
VGVEVIGAFAPYSLPRTIYPLAIVAGRRQPYAAELVDFLLSEARRHSTASARPYFAFSRR